MATWNYYVSGILYGSFKKEEGQVRYRWLNPETASLSDWRELDEAENAGLLAWSKLNVLDSLNGIRGLERDFAGGGASIRTEAGDYTMREPGLYARRNTVFPTDLLFKGGELVAFIAPAREVCAVLVREGNEKDTILSRWQEYAGEESPRPVRFAGTFHVPMRDGARLATDVYLPGGARERLPAVLVRTCYGKGMNRHMYYRYAQRGYALVIQDVRGREESEGTFIPMHSEVEDGGDTLDWVAAQDWSSGKVGTVGGSYLGYVQWAMAASGNPHLAAIISVVTAGSPFVDLPRRGGLFTSGMLAWAFMMSERGFKPELARRNDWDELLNVRPIGDIAEKGLGKRIPYLDEWLAHGDDDDFWQKSDWARRNPGRQIPTLIMSGWFDDNGMGTTEALALTGDWPDRKVVLGPWNHGANTRYDIHGVPMGERALRYDLDLLFFRWFDRHLRGKDNGVNLEPAVEYYTLAENRWKTAEAWPPACAEPYSLYLSEAGALLPEPGADGCETYDYDPRNPAVHLVDLSENELEMPEDYTEEEKRPDVLCFTTPPLERGLTVTGEMSAVLFISSDAADTDFIVRITEVDESGRSIKYADGMLGAKYRESFERPAYLENGCVYKLTIRMTKLSRLFAAGKRVRLTVTSSAKNFAFPNSGTEAGYNSEKTVIARNAVYYGVKYPSRVILQVEKPC